MVGHQFLELVMLVRIQPPMPMEPEGKIQVYTGKGKGKTTAALGLLIRSLGHGLTPCWISYFKGSKRYHEGALSVLEKLGVQHHNIIEEHPAFGNNNSENISELCYKSITNIRETFINYPDKWDLLFLDEFNIVIRDGYVDIVDFLSLLDQKPNKLELIITGRCAHPKLLERADLVSRIEEEKHYYADGVVARLGIEY